MGLKFLMVWFTIISCILVVIGAIFSFFGFSVISEISGRFTGFSTLPSDSSLLIMGERYLRCDYDGVGRDASSHRPVRI